LGKVETSVAVIVPFESPSNASIDQLVGLVADMERQRDHPVADRSEVTMIPEVANHPTSGGKRLRPMLTPMPIHRLFRRRPYQARRFRRSAHRHAAA
jgi:hypothetical protein